MDQNKKTLPLIAALEVERSPGGSLRCDPQNAVIDGHTPQRSHLQIWRPSNTPTVAGPQSSDDNPPPPKKCRRSLALSNERISCLLMDSGSEEEDDDEPGSEDEATSYIRMERSATRKLRRLGTEVGMEGMAESADRMNRMDECIMEEGRDREEVGMEGMAESAVGMDECIMEEAYEGLIVLGEVQDKNVINTILTETRVIGIGDEEGELPTLADIYEGLEVFNWSGDFSTFSGREETYQRTPGINFASQDPAEIFQSIWDNEIMERIMTETNKYAWNYIATLSEVENGIPDYLKYWEEVTIPELYRYFAFLILMSMCYRSKVKDYWTTGLLELPKVRQIMPRNRFMLITKFLHFVDNNEIQTNMRNYDKKLFKVRPIIDHCNKKFSSLYVPNKHLSLDESLLLWKGRLSWVQCIRTKAARFGIKSYDLCEATTGYLLRCLLYAGKESSCTEEPIHGFKSCTAKVVLELMDGYLDVGHTLVMDNWYNQLPLTRFLKRRQTDVIGTMNARVHVPDDIKNAKDASLERGEQIAVHCGDISMVAWKDVKLVTAISTYHDNAQTPATRAGQLISKPVMVNDYNKFMGGVDSKDQQLSMYLMERKRGQKWYMKVFKRLINTSLLNSYIIYRKNPTLHQLSHREFRHEVALGLLSKYPLEKTTATATTSSSGTGVLDKNKRRLMKANHFVEYTELMPGRNTHKQNRCARCTAAGRRKMVITRCTFCCAHLCIGTCWAEYHTLENLK